MIVSTSFWILSLCLDKISMIFSSWFFLVICIYKRLKHSSDVVGGGFDVNFDVCVNLFEGVVEVRLVLYKVR